MEDFPGPTERGNGKTAVRVDRSGVREQAMFLDQGGKGVFGVVHLPPSNPIGGLVVCSSFQAEAVATYRKEVLLARALAPRGVAVMRFHYRGAGHSDGYVEDMTLDSMRDDTMGAVRYLVGTTGVRNVAFMGTGLGSLVAAAAAKEHGAGPLVLLEPATKGASYFKDVFRQLLVYGLASGQSGSSTGDIIGRLRSDGFVDVMGYTIGRAMYESCLPRTLEAELGEDARLVLMIRVGGGPRKRPDLARLASGLAERGFEVSLEEIPGEMQSWFIGAQWQPAVEVASRKALIDLTADWLVPRLAHEAT